MVHAMSAPVRPLPPNAIVKVSGVSFRQDAVKTVVEGDEVRVRHDQENQFDAHACSVITRSGEQLGFVPAELAARLAVPHPGGVWRARVVEVLRNDTWGLRIQIGPLVAAGLRDPGATAPGLRHRGDGTIEAPNGAVAVAEPVDAPAVVATCARPKVHARSGRLLGELVSRDGGRVHVRTQTGLDATYPAAVVRIVA